jgi:hypothetical protein
MPVVFAYRLNAIINIKKFLYHKTYLTLPNHSQAETKKPIKKPQSPPTNPKFSCMDSNHDLLNQNQTCYHCTTGKYEVSTRFELVNIPFAEDSLKPLGQLTINSGEPG